MKLTSYEGLARYTTPNGDFYLSVDRAGNPSTYGLDGEPLVSGVDEESALNGTATYLAAKASGDQGTVINSGFVGGKL